MGKSSDQVTGYRYFTNLLLFIGNPIEKVLGINFDKRGWHTPLIDKMGNPLSVGVIEKATLYGENEGGVAGQIHARYGTDNQEVVSFYKDYMDSKELPASAFPYQSYLAFTGMGRVTLQDIKENNGSIFSDWGYYNNAFYVGNSGYMKEMLLWPKRTRIRNDGRRQWYEVRGDGAVVCEIGTTKTATSLIKKQDIPNFIYNFKGNATQHTYTSAVGINWIFGAMAYGGVENSNITDRISTEPEGATELGLFDLVEIKINAYFESSSAVISFVNAEILHLNENKTNEPDGTKLIKMTALCKPLNGFPHVVAIGTGTIFKSQTNRFSFQVATTTTAIDSKNYIDIGDGVDINPIHKIREILTDDTAMNKPEASVNNDNFIKAADRIYDEGLGISWSITEKSCMDAINELCYHIEAGIRVNRQTGLYEMVLFRDDWFDEDEIHTISESKIKSMQYEITNADEVINQVNVNFYDRANIKNSSFSISESGLIQTLGRVNAETVDFPYFMNMRNAEIVANWKLKILSTGVYKGIFTTGWREARKWNRYDLIRLPWSKRWNGTILVRIMSINLGGPTNNEVSIDFIEVVPSTGMMNTTIVADDVIDKPLPPQACQYEPFELPYYLAVMALGQRQVDDELAYESNFGLVGTVAERPQENSLYAVMMTNNSDEWVRAGSIQYSATADLDQIISKKSTSFTVKNWKNIANVPVGTLIKCGRDWLGTPGEWMVFQSVDPYTGIFSVKRGALDTPPQEWGLGSKLYFCGNDVAFDETEYVAGEEVLVSALTTTPSGVMEQGGSIPIEMKARAIRPYPPANVKINGEYWPTEIETDLILTWVHRNRLQQTGGSILGWFDDSITSEIGVSYFIKIFGLDVSSNEIELLNKDIGNVNTYDFNPVDYDYAQFKIILYTVRDGFESLYRFEHTVYVALTAPTNLTATYVQ